jgi:hypothetical protein
MKPEGAKTKNPLNPEVMAVKRSSFDGYFEPDSKASPKKPAKTTAKKPAMR